MLKKRIAALGIIVFAASLVPWSASAAEAVPTAAPTKKCIAVTNQPKADQPGTTAEKKPAKRKGCMEHLRAVRYIA